MKTYRLFDHDCGEEAEREARSAEEAVKDYIRDIDEMEGDSFDVSAFTDRGEWKRYTVLAHRETHYQITRERSIPDPTEDAE